MEGEPLVNLREWAPLNDLLNKIPGRIQKGFLYQELNITCVNVLPNFIALGTNAGIVFWYNRSSGEIQKLRCESTSSITCLKIISSVEYLVAVGSSSGQVNVFVIQKEHAVDLNLVGPVTKLKPIERYTIKDLHHCSIKCVEWSKNGMKLFSGDQNGVVVLTEFDFQTHISKSIEILNEAYEIVQICFNQPFLLISTIYRAIICERENDGKWNVLQIGKRDRKVLSDFGAIFTGSNRAPTVICGRPGFRFWVADTKGNVSHTYLLKDAVQKASFEVPLLNPSRSLAHLSTNFGRCYLYMERFLVTHNDYEIFILNLEKLKIEASIRSLRKVQSLTICENEIFILEGPRTLIRIATAPEPPDKTCSKIIFNPSLSTTSIITQSNSFVPPVEFEAEEDDVINAEECFELPPIEQIDLSIPLRTSLSEHNLLRQDRLLLEHSKKAKIFEKINNLDYDSSILFNSGSKKKKTKKPETMKTSGIVEIGQQVGDFDHLRKKEKEAMTQSEAKSPLEVTAYSFGAKPVELTTRPCLLDVSFCEGTGVVPDLRSPNTLNKVIETKEKLLAAALDIQPVKFEKPIKPSVAKLTPDLVPAFHYSLNYPITHETPHTTPLKRIHFLNEDNVDGTPQSSTSFTTKRSHKPYTREEQPDLITISFDPNSSEQLTEFLNVKNDIPEIKQMPNSMNIPKLWNVQVEQINEDDVQSESQRSSDGWEMIDI